MSLPDGTLGGGEHQNGTDGIVPALVEKDRKRPIIIKSSNNYNAIIAAHAPHDVFNGDNYVTWKIRIIRDIQGPLRAPLALLEEPEEGTETEAEIEERQEQEMRAFALLCHRIGDLQTIMTRQCMNVREAFEILDLRYAKNSRANLLSYQEKLDALKIDAKKGPEEFFREFEVLRTQIAECGKDLDDEDISLMYIRALPNSLTSIRTSCRTLLQVNEGSSQIIRNHIIDEMAEYTRQKPERSEKRRTGSAVEMRSMKKPSKESNVDWKSAKNVEKKKRYEGKFDKAKVTCHKCKGKGHFANECSKHAAPAAAKMSTTTEPEKTKPASNPYDEKFARIAFIANEQTNDESLRPKPSNPLEIIFQGDSGANFHMIKECRDHMIDVKVLSKEDGRIRTADGGEMFATHQGDLRIRSDIDGHYVCGRLKDVLYVPKLHSNLLSTTRFMSDGYSLTGENDKVTIRNTDREKIIVGEIINRIIYVRLSLSEEKMALTSMHKEGTLWHRRMGHLNGRYVQVLPGMSEGVPSNRVLETMTNCQVCSESKMRKLPFDDSRTPAQDVLNHIYCDIMGRILPISESGHQYVLVIIDQWSRYITTYNLETKDEATDHLIGHINFVSAMMECQVKKVTCDNGGEFRNNTFINYCHEKGIVVEFTPPYTPELNGLVERANGTIGNRMRALLYESHVPLELWDLAADAAVYIINRSPHVALKYHTPYERWFGEKPELSHLRVFGCVARVHIPDELRTKLEKKSWTGILVGHLSNCYKVYNFGTRKVEFSRHVSVDESADIRSLHPSLAQDHEQKLVIENLRDLDSIENIIIADAAHTNSVNREITYDDAVRGTEAGHFCKAIQDELDIIKSRGVWNVVPREKQHLIDSRWVFTKKLNSDGSVKYRARLCGRGFKDKNDYALTDTYSPTAKLSTVRLLIALALELGWRNKHVDISSAFLYGELRHEIFMRIPQGMDVDGRKYVLKLEKALYGLKVAAKEWNVIFGRHIKEIGYVPLKSEPCVYHNNCLKNSAIVLAFVDDLLFTGPDPEEFTRVIEFLKTKFQLRDMGPAEKFLGIHISYEEDAIILDQCDYIAECVERFNIPRREYKTPMEVGLKLEESVGDDDTNVRPIIGSLMYVAICTRPDVCFSINYLSRFQGKANHTLMKYCQRVLAYLFRSNNHRLRFVKGNGNIVLKASSDASFASDNGTRRSTSGLLIQLNRNAVAWLSRRQRSVTKSATEAEYYGLSLADSEIRSISNILSELQIPHKCEMLCDNTGAESIAKKSFTKGCRHIEVSYRVVEESIERERYMLDHEPGKSILADIFTKSLGAGNHERLTREILNDQSSDDKSNS